MPRSVVSSPFELHDSTYSASYAKSGYPHRLPLIQGSKLQLKVKVVRPPCQHLNSLPLGSHTPVVTKIASSSSSKTLPKQPFIITRTLKAVVGDKALHHELTPKSPYIPTKQSVKKEIGEVIEGAKPAAPKAIRYKSKLPEASLNLCTMCCILCLKSLADWGNSLLPNRLSIRFRNSGITQPEIL